MNVSGDLGLAAIELAARASTNAARVLAHRKREPFTENETSVAQQSFAG